MAESNDRLLDFVDLENEFYVQGYNHGLQDGRVAGLAEGKIFGIEKGFEKTIEMGRLRGRAALWAHRVAENSTKDSYLSVTKITQKAGADQSINTKTKDILLATFGGNLPEKLSSLSVTGRVGKHLDSLFSIISPHHLSLQNDEDSSEDLELRLKKATSKIKVIANVTGEPADDLQARPGDGSGSIEDISSLSVRH